MGKIHFKPNQGKKVNDYSKPQKIYIRYELGRKVSFRASIGAEVMLSDNPKESDWDEVNQKVKDRSNIKDRHTINGLISNLRKHFEDYDRKNTENGIIPSHKEVRAHFKSYFSESTEQTELNLLQYFDKYIEDSKTKPNPNTGKLSAKSTIKGFKSTYEILKSFNDNVYKIDFDNITLDWYYDFIEFCNKKNYSQNYIGKLIKNLKVVLQLAVENGLTDNQQFKSRKFKVLKEDADHIYLTLDELNKLWHVDLSRDERKERARDLFLIGAYTGLRVSDYNSLQKENIRTVNGKEMIVKRTRKTDEEVMIPVHPIVRAILDKNNGNPPQRIPDQHINKLIKEIAEDAEIDGVEYIETTRGGMRITEKKYRYQLVHTHTARRSFCTNAYLMGMPTLDIMQISGHRTETAFMKYIKVTKEQVAERMSLHPFFTHGQLRKV